jgi:predicted N-formylglutamate amidohydrolase
MTPAIQIDGAGSDLLLIADHASNHVPDGIALGIAPALLDQHIAIDIGVHPLAERLCARIGCHAVLGGVSRLVIDYNRELDAPGLIPETSDGTLITGNAAIDPDARAQRIDAWWRPYHAAISHKISTVSPKMLISLHSFTPQLSSKAEERPWQIGVLYNQDERAARIAIPLLEAQGVVTGDNLPYSGKVLNATMNTHGEGNGIPYLGLEVRQDLIGDAEGLDRWADLLAPIIAATADALDDGPLRA